MLRPVVSRSDVFRVRMWRGSFREYLPFIIARSMKHEYRWGYDRRVEFCFPLESTVRSVKERKNTLQYTKRKKKKKSKPTSRSEWA